jgi:RNA polymerase sigma factor (sigma-70 family)
MDGHDLLAARFEEHRVRLRSVAHRMLGTSGEADDAVQETWLRLDRSDTRDVANLGGWLTTVLARVCLDMLRARAAQGVALRRLPEPVAIGAQSGDPEQEALLADSVGFAMLVVLETLEPAERLAFILHDVFAVPFDEIATIVDRTPAATRQLASRARRRVRGAEPPPETDASRQRQIVDAFLAASRGGDFDALVALLDPDCVYRQDQVVVGDASTIAKRAVEAGARAAQAALIDGEVGVIIAPLGKLLMVLRFTVTGGKVTAIDAITDAAALAALDLKVF